MLISKRRDHITLGKILNISVAQFPTSVKWGREAGGRQTLYLVEVFAEERTCHGKVFCK